MENFIDTIWLQNCGDYLKVLEKTQKKEGTNFLWKCIFLNNNEIVYYTKRKIIIGKACHKDSIIFKDFPQKCGDILRVLKETNNKKNNTYLYECEFLKYPYKTFVSRRDILQGKISNPQIEQVEFIDKIWPQNCGDSLRIIKKTNNKQGNNYLWECEFIKYPCGCILTLKSKIIKGQVENPNLENFVNFEFEQNCKDILKVIKKTNIKYNNDYLYCCQFQKYPCEVLALKRNILNKVVNNPNYPDNSKDLLINFINKNFINKPTLRELSIKLNRGYSTIMHKINEFELRDYIKYCPISTQENNIKEYCEKLLKQKIFCDNKILNGKEIDIYIPNLKLGIEFNGNLWHSNHKKYGVENVYHQTKSLLAQEKKIQLIHIWEWEYEQKEDLIKSFIKSKLGIFERKIFARKCQIKELSNKEYQGFCNNNHLQGECGANIKFGLFYKEELVQIMSFDRPRFTNNFEYEIIRECSKLNYIILGGKEKLWSHFVKIFQPKSVISYCDFSKFTGNSYLKLGFKKERLNKPGFWWYDNKLNCIYSRNPAKHKEMKEKGYLKIYDAGQLVFVWNK